MAGGDAATLVGTFLGGSGVLIATALAAAPQQDATAEASGWLTFSPGEIAVVAGLLGAVCGALGLMFRTLQASSKERIAFLEAQLTLTQTQVTALQATVNSQTEKFQVSIGGQTERVVNLLREEMVANREVMARSAQAIEEMTDVGREGREQNRRAHEKDEDEHREIVVTLHALGQVLGRTLGDRRDPHMRELQRQAERIAAPNDEDGG